jgi:hypothetical protein
LENKNNIKILNRHTDEFAEILVREDHLVEVQLKGREYNKAKIDAVIATIRQLTPAESLLVLIIAHDRSAITLDGIKELFSKEALSYPIAKAYVIRKNAHFVLAKVCMLVYQPVTPIRFFSRQSEAEDWLKSLDPSLKKS